MMKLKFQHLSFPSHLFDNCLYSDPAWKTSAQYRAGHRITGPLQGKLTCVEFGFMGISGQATQNVMHDLSSFLERISPNCPNYSAIQGLILASKIHPGQWEAVAVQLHALNQNTWRYIASRFITWHYIHIYVVSSIAIYLVKTHIFFFISPGVWLSSKDSSKLLCHVICVVFWLVRNHKSSKLICLGDSISLPRQFGNMILFNIYILYTYQIVLEMPRPDSCSHKTCCWISVFRPNCCIQGRCYSHLPLGP